MKPKLFSKSAFQRHRLYINTLGWKCDLEKFVNSKNMSLYISSFCTVGFVYTCEEFFNLINLTFRNKNRSNLKTINQGHGFWQSISYILTTFAKCREERFWVLAKGIKCNVDLESEDRWYWQTGQKCSRKSYKWEGHFRVMPFDIKLWSTRTNV